jgi:hypothetical protein
MTLRRAMVEAKVYTINQFTSGKDSAGNVTVDTSGFVFQKSSTDTSLVYRHKPGTEYPVTCLIAPQTNLDWRNYEFSGKIIKPAGDVYDSAGVGVVFYQKDPKNYYSLRVNGKANDTSGNANKFYIVSHFERYGSEWDSELGLVSNTLFEGNVDTMNFSIRVITRVYQDTIKDGEVSIEAVIWPENYSKPTYPVSHPVDVSSTRKVEGLCGIIFNYLETSLTYTNNLSGIKVQKIKIQKVGD